jgi:hypothetical protein
VANVWYRSARGARVLLCVKLTQTNQHGSQTHARRNIAWLVVEVVLIRTGGAAVWSVSLGRWRGENISEEEGRIYGPAGTLSFLWEGRRVVTANGMLFAGILVYVALAFSLLAYAGSA